MGIDVRTITDDEVPAWCAALNTGFLNASGDVDAEHRRPTLLLDRTWAGFDGKRLVSTLRSFPTPMTVPGGAALNASAVTAVTTTSSHLRRGLAARMVENDLAAAAARGEQASVLVSAQYGIYGRYGYGPATEHQSIDVRGSARLRRSPAGTVECVDRDTARAEAPAVYERHHAGQPGEIGRVERYWDLHFGIMRYPSWPETKPALHLLARDRSGVVTGVASYLFDERWDHRQPEGRATVQTWVTDGPDAEALLWHHLLAADWVHVVHADNRPVDGVLPWLLTDARDVRASERADFLWLRPLDVAGMLAARTYPAPGKLVVEVVDKAGFAAGRFALSGGPDGACCAPTTASPDLTVDVGVLGSVYLGGYRLRTLAMAGLVDEHSPGAVALGDAMFASPVTPWCSTWF